MQEMRLVVAVAATLLALGSGVALAESEALGFSVGRRKPHRSHRSGRR